MRSEITFPRMPDSVAADAVYKRVTFRIIPLVFTCYVFAYFARVNVSFAKLDMLGDLGFSETVYGIGAGVFFVGYVVFAVPSNMMLKRFGARRWIALIMVLWAGFGILIMFTTTPVEFYIYRFLIGVCEAGFFPGLTYYFTEWFPTHRRGAVMALFMAAIPVSGVLGGFISGAIMSLFASGPLGLASWQWLFLLYGIPTIALGTLVWGVLPDNFRQAKFLSSAEQDLIAKNLSAAGTEKSLDDTPNPTVSVLNILKNRWVWTFSFAWFIIQMGEYSLGFWMPTIINDFQISTFLTGVLTALPYLIAGVVMILVGRSSDKHQENKWHLIVPILIGAAGLLIAAILSGSLVFAMVGLIIASIGVLSSEPLFWTFPQALLSAEVAVIAFPLINSIGNLAGIISPPLVGYTKDLTGSTDGALIIIGILLLIAAVTVVKMSQQLSALTLYPAKELAHGYRVQ